MDLNKEMLGKQVYVEEKVYGKRTPTALYYGTYRGVEPFFGKKMIILENAWHFNCAGISFTHPDNSYNVRIDSKKVLIRLEDTVSIDILDDTNKKT